MSLMTVALNSFTPVSTPTIVDNVEIDGYVDGKPVILRRMRDGMLMPAIGTVLPLSMGTGIVSGYSNDMLVVDVVEPNEDFEFETKDSENPDILDVHEYIASLNRCYRRSIESIHSDFTRLYKSEITGRLSDKNEDRMHLSFPLPSSDTEIVIGFKGDYLAPTDSIVVQEVVKQRETPSERRARIKAEQALALKRANELLAEFGDDECPDDVAADIAAEFGDLDMEF